MPGSTLHKTKYLIIIFFLVNSTLFGFFDSPCPKWMNEEIENDLHPFQDGIYEEFLDRLMLETPPLYALFRFKIINGNIYINPKYQQSIVDHRRKIVERVLHQLLSQHSLPDLDFILCQHETCDLSDTVPVLATSKRSGQVNIAIPDFYALNGYQNLDQQMEKGSSKWPWHKKRAIAFWRGSTTGGVYDLTNWRNFPRSKLVFLSQQYPSIIDAKFTNFYQGAEHNPEMLNMPGIRGHFVSPSDSLKYKYLVDVDGNTCAWDRLYWSLLSNSVVFKQKSTEREWYYSILKPYEHFIPIASDCSDLPMKIEWAKSHDAEARQISENATNFVRQNLNKNAIHQYFYHVLLKYAELQRFQPKIDSNEWVKS